MLKYIVEQTKVHKFQFQALSKVLKAANEKKKWTAVGGKSGGTLFRNSLEIKRNLLLIRK